MAIYGATLFEAQNNESNYQYDAIGKNSEAFTSADPVTIISGNLTVGGNSNAILGIVAKTATMTSSNAGSSGAKVAPAYIPVDEDTEFLMGSNTALTSTAVNAGNYCNLTPNTTGTVQVDGSNVARTTTDRVVMIRKVDPFNEGDLTKVVVTFVKKFTDVAGV